MCHASHQSEDHSIIIVGPTQGHGHSVGEGGSKRFKRCQIIAVLTTQFSLSTRVGPLPGIEMLSTDWLQGWRQTRILVLLTVLATSN